MCNVNDSSPSAIAVDIFIVPCKPRSTVTNAANENHARTCIQNVRNRIISLLSQEAYNKNLFIFANSVRQLRLLP